MTVRTEKSGAVWTMILSRPEARNAVNPEHAIELYDAFLAFDRDDSASVAVFTGDSGVFCAGFDLKVAAKGGEQNRLSELAFPEPDDGRHLRGPMGPTRLELTKPVIAAIEGPAVAGGMELALWCDMRVMGASAYMGVYCRRWGVPLIDGGTVRLPRLVGEGRARDIILTGRKVMAEECYRIGLCERLVPDGEARQVAEELAQELARLPQICLRADRRSINLQEGKSEREALRLEYGNSAGVVALEGAAGAARFAAGAGRHGERAEPSFL
ncbi:MAG TPA: crotonase/enoyl-CoA hydratase family protein [Beijerinckiaceae bacterium]|jgi:enoyl-CoA hydratase|nr:crotonase/enoyl-CoA hydratase family protein [Beijerinckiaceae bacterium]